MILEKNLTWENFIFRPKFTRECLTFLVGLLSPVKPTKKVSEFPDSHLQPITRNRLSYVKISGVFISKRKRIGSAPENATLATADIVGLYPSITHDVGLKALKQTLDKRKQKKSATADLLNMAEFVLKSNFFDFSGNIKQPIS